MESVTTKKSFVRANTQKKVIITNTFSAPKSIGILAASEPKRQSKGLGNNRMYVNNVKNIAHNIKQLDTSESNETLVETATSNATMVMDAFQVIDDLKQQNQILQQQNQQYKQQKEEWIKYGIPSLHTTNINKQPIPSDYIQINYNEWNKTMKK